MKIVVEFATAYAITKVLLPVRIAGSLAATPWFARVAVVPFLSVFKRVFGKRGAVAGGVSAKTSTSVASPAAGTNAVGAGVVSEIKK